MMLFLVICVLLAAVYIATKAASIERRQASIAELFEARFKEIRTAQEIRPKPLPYGWFDDGWPYPRTKEEISAPLENPEPQRNADDYQTQMWIREFQAMGDAHDRKEFLRQLRKAGAWMRPEFLDAVYADESPFVRAWGAAHLALGFKDYSDFKNPHELRNYEPNLLNDPDPLVCAAVWSNPECGRLPWAMYGIHLSEHWKEEFHRMSALDRLGLMRNPELPKSYVVALLETPSEELNISREEHERILMTAAVNPVLINDSRGTGRQSWVGGCGDAFPAREEYARMWELCLERWLEEPGVAYIFLKYIQATPEVKLATYKRLREKGDGKERKWLRQEVVRSCDPIIDRDVLKLAWDDPDEDCRKLAAVRVGPFAQLVGIDKKKV